MDKSNGTAEEISLQIENQSIRINVSNDYYGVDFWKSVEASKYEPDTLDFIRRRTDKESDFMDIGAANGAMTLIAAIQGARVIAYEPDPQIRKVLQRNVELNDQNWNISISGAAISNFNGKLCLIRELILKSLAILCLLAKKRKVQLF